MSNLHLIISINSSDYSKKIVHKTMDWFGNKNIKTYLSIMGPNPTIVKKSIPDGVDEIIYTDCFSYNYAFSINKCLKFIEKKYDENEIIAISDMWTPFSTTQIFQDIDKTIFEKEFLTINSYMDKEKDYLDINISNIMQAVTLRTKFMRDKEIPYNYIVISKLKYLINYENGLEETLFTEISRKNLIRQLKIIGLKQRISNINSLILKGGYQYGPRLLKKEDLTLEDLYKRNQHSLFIPSNFGEDWGVDSKLNNLQVDSSKNPYWKNKSKRVIRYIPSLNLEDVVVEKIKFDPSEVSEIIIERPDSDILELFGMDLKNISEETSINEKNYMENIKDEEIIDAIKSVSTNTFSENNKIEEVHNEILEFEIKNSLLIMIHDNLESVISATPLINKISTKYKTKVNILTNKKDSENINILRMNPNIDNIYDIVDLNCNYINLNNYTILNTPNCNIEIGKRKVLPYYFEIQNNLNHLLLSNYFFDEEYNYDKLKDVSGILEENELEPNSNKIIISFSIQKNTKNFPSKEYMRILELLAGKLSNMGYKIILCHLNSERIIINQNIFNNRKNIKIHYGLNYQEFLQLLKESFLLITPDISSARWLGIGSKIKTCILSEKSDGEIDIPWIKTLNTHHYTIDGAIEAICN